jgi:hypothetical protein
MSITFYTDVIDTYNVNVSHLNASLIITDGTNYANINSSTINFSSIESNTTTTISLGGINVSGENVSLTLTDISSSVVISGKSINLGVSTQITVNGSTGNDGDVLTSSGPNNTPHWHSISDFLNIEAGKFHNVSGARGVDILFGREYTEAPTVLITANSDGSGNVIPVSLDGVNMSGAKVIFSSTKLNYLNYVIFPLTSSSNMNYYPIF